MARGKRKGGGDELSHIRELAASWRRERPELDHPNFFLPIFVNRLGRILDADYDRMCRAEYGLSGPEMRVLLALRRAGPPYTRRPTDLFKALLVTSGAMTKQVDRLVASGHVVKLPDPKVGRGTQVELTDKGLRAADACVSNLAKHSILSRAIIDMKREDVVKSCQLIEDLLVAIEKVEP